jgi:hypothetical protein
MGRNVEQLLLRLTMLGLCGVVMANTSLASPPPNRIASLHLDLRAPSAALQIEENASAQFHSLLRPQTSNAPEQSRFPGLAIEASRVKTLGRADEFAQRVHREGLPIARLWQNKSALVSLGLNQAGKPGLWLVQKLH